MENKKLLVLLLLMGGGYLVWKNSKTASTPVSSGTGGSPTGTPSEYGTGEVITGSEYAPSDFPQSQKDCPEGKVYQAINCITTPCYGGLCVEPKIVDLPVEALPVPKPVFDPLSPLDESGFSFDGFDKNTLALQENVKEGLVKQSNFN